MCSTPGVHPETTAAIIREESGGNEWAIGINEAIDIKKSYNLNRVKTKAKAQEVAKSLQENDYNFDAGLMQINSQNFLRMGLTAESVFDPCTNIKAGTAILKSFYEVASMKIGPGQEALMAALSAYNTGNHKSGFINGYVNKFYGKRKLKNNPYRSSIFAVNDWPKSKQDPYTSSIEGEK